MSTKRVPVRIGDVLPVVLPYSEVCMAMRMAGKVNTVYVGPHGAYMDAGHGPHLTHGEAGITGHGDDGLWATVPADAG